MPGEREAAAEGAAGNPPTFVLPEAVRQRVVALAADALGALRPDEIPATLRAIARFAAPRRAKLAATQIAAVLETDAVFRAAVSARVRASMPALAAALADGSPPPAADPVDVAAVAYLIRPTGWQAHLQAAGQEAQRTAEASGSVAAAETVGRLQDQMATLRAAAKADSDRLRSELDRAKAEIAELRRKLYDARERMKAAAAEVKATESAAEAAVAEAVATQAVAEAEMRRMKSRLADAEQAVEAARRATREGRSSEAIRLRLLLDTVVDAAHGLRRELALPPAPFRPADAVDAIAAGAAGVGAVAGRALAEEDPAVLDALLALPQVHLIVDGYNVTKSGYGSLPLEDQRSRLIAGLSALAAQSGAEVTCVFDGAAISGKVPARSTRGVRVLFSKPGQTADDVIRHLVHAEPAGRPLVVVSSDREVAEGTRKAGARPLPSVALIRRLSRS